MHLPVALNCTLFQISSKWYRRMHLTMLYLNLCKCDLDFTTLSSVLVLHWVYYWSHQRDVLFTFTAVFLGLSTKITESVLYVSISAGEKKINEVSTSRFCIWHSIIYYPASQRTFLNTKVAQLDLIRLFQVIATFTFAIFHLCRLCRKDEVATQFSIE
mgnify:CR=1 FL=1